MKLDEIYIISDLHLGGEQGFQIFLCKSELVGLINLLKNKPNKRSVGLVINGDFVDFLAEPSPKSFDPDGAIPKLDRIFRDPEFEPIWQALQQFVSTTDRYLIIILGNHDIELALPKVQNHLLEKLSKGKDNARGRIHFSLQGSGWTCEIGGANILCTHGNEVDTWNVVDYEKLRRAGRDQLMKRPIKMFKPNAGTMLVIEVMNDIKKKYPFVDLLKPEIEGVVPILVALDQTKARVISNIVDSIGKLTWDALRRWTGFLSEDEEVKDEWELRQDMGLEDSPEAGGTLNRVLGNAFGSFTRTQDEDLADRLMISVNEQNRNNISPFDLINVDESNVQLGYAGAIWDWIRGKDKDEILLEALESLKKDRSFKTEDKDDEFEHIDKLIGENFDYVICGHTHLERAIRRTKSGGLYYNSGTWAGLINLTPKMLETRESFDPVYKALQKNTITKIDETLPGLIQRKPACVSIWVMNGAVKSALHRVVQDNGETKLDVVWKE